MRARLAAIVKRAVGASADDSRYPRTWLFHRRWGKRGDAKTARGEPTEHVDRRAYHRMGAVGAELNVNRSNPAQCRKRPSFRGPLSKSARRRSALSHTVCARPSIRRASPSPARIGRRGLDNVHECVEHRGLDTVAAGAGACEAPSPCRAATGTGAAKSGILPGLIALG